LRKDGKIYLYAWGREKNLQTRGKEDILERGFKSNRGKDHAATVQRDFHRIFKASVYQGNFRPSRAGSKIEKRWQVRERAPCLAPKKSSACHEKGKRMR